MFFVRTNKKHSKEDKKQAVVMSLCNVCVCFFVFFFVFRRIKQKKVYLCAFLFLEGQRSGEQKLIRARVKNGFLIFLGFGWWCGGGLL